MSFCSTSSGNQIGFNLEFFSYSWLIWHKAIAPSAYTWLSWSVLALAACMRKLPLLLTSKGGYSWLSQQIGTYSGEFFTVACAPEAMKTVKLTLSSFLTQLASDASHWYYCCNLWGIGHRAVPHKIYYGSFVNTRQVLFSRLFSLKFNRNLVTNLLTSIYWSNNNYYKVCLSFLAFLTTRYH